MPPVDWIATLVATVSAFVLGGIWYSPLLFAKTWQRETGLSDEQLNAASKGRIFGISFVLCFLAAAVFSMFVGPEPALGFSINAGLSVGVFWVATSFGVNYLFELKGLKLWLINSGYHAVQFTLYGTIFGLM